MNLVSQNWIHCLPPLPRECEYLVVGATGGNGVNFTNGTFACGEKIQKLLALFIIFPEDCLIPHCPLLSLCGL